MSWRWWKRMRSRQKQTVRRTRVVMCYKVNMRDKVEFCLNFILKSTFACIFSTLG